MLESRRAAEAADLIWRHWQAGTVMAALPDELRPESRAEGYAVQAGLERFSDKPLFGWKIAATSVAAQRHIGVGGPLAGRILPQQVHPPGAPHRIRPTPIRVPRPELDVRFHRDLPPSP